MMCHFNVDGTMKLQIKKLHPEAKLPTYATDGSAAMDLYVLEGADLFDGDVTKFRTGVAIYIVNAQYCGLVLPRSGLSTIGVVIDIPEGPSIANGVGLIDADYQGEICVVLRNNSGSYYRVSSGDRIAQLLITPIIRAKLVEVQDFAEATKRGAGGFGSTGQ